MNAIKIFLLMLPIGTLIINVINLYRTVKLKKKSEKVIKKLIHLSSDKIS